MESEELLVPLVIPTEIKELSCATVYAMENLRCNLCLEVFAAAPPEGVGPEKYDATAGAMIA
jgi:hypothetical protein